MGYVYYPQYLYLFWKNALNSSSVASLIFICGWEKNYFILLKEVKNSWVCQGFIRVDLVVFKILMISMHYHANKTKPY